MPPRVGHGAARADDAIEAAVALELIHSATLLHDDIIDGGETRRGRPSALRTFGLADTLVGGDFLFSRAFALCARFEAEVIRWAADACVALTEGEIMQGRFRHNPAVTVADYMEIIERKTASLFATGARTAAHLAGTPPALVDAMAGCGRDLGLAFQLSDDLLDVAGRPAVTGKPRGIDLRDGNPSLPIVLAMARDPEFARVFADPEPDAAQVEQTLASHPALGRPRRDRRARADPRRGGARGDGEPRALALSHRARGAGARARRPPGLAGSAPKLFACARRVHSSTHRVSGQRPAGRSRHARRHRTGGGLRRARGAERTLRRPRRRGLELVTPVESATYIWHAGDSESSSSSATA